MKPLLEERLNQAHILVIDDEPDIGRMLVALLKFHGYGNVRATTDPHSFAALYHEFRPDLILLDLMMPRLNGFEVMAQLQSLIPQGDFLPVLVLTADNSREIRQKALQAGADDFLTKPFDQTEVLLRIHNLLKTRFLHLQLQEQNATLHLLSQRLIEAQESERRRIAQALHDEIGAAFTSVKLNMQVVQQHLKSQACGLETHLQDGIDILSQAHQQVRELSLDLRPSMLDDFGLVDTLEWYVDRQSRWAGLEAGFQMEPLEPRPDAAIETACFRIAQEAMTNIIRHAGASRVEIELCLREDELRLAIRDDGAGFDVKCAQEKIRCSGSLGLMGMQERAVLLGGRMNIKSGPGRGTEIQVCFPLTCPPAPPTFAEGRRSGDKPDVEAQTPTERDTHFEREAP
jgi:signal transduction histidine kinase